MFSLLKRINHHFCAWHWSGLWGNRQCPLDLSISTYIIPSENSHLLCGSFPFPYSASLITSQIRWEGSTLTPLLFIKHVFILLLFLKDNFSPSIVLVWHLFSLQSLKIFHFLLSFWYVCCQTNCHLFAGDLPDFLFPLCSEFYYNVPKEWVSFHLLYLSVFYHWCKITGHYLLIYCLC